jgi:hypothetical protein
MASIAPTDSLFTKRQRGAGSLQHRHSNIRTQYFLSNLSNSGLAVRRYSEGGATGPAEHHLLSNKEHGETVRGLQETTMPARKTDKTSKPAVRKPAKRTAAPGKVATTLPEAMTGRASPAKAAVGDKPVFAYIASLPQPQRGIAESVDALAAKTLPGLQRSVKWGMSYYGVGDGWCFCCGGFAGHVKLMFVNGAALKPVPPVTPVGMGKSTRGVELESVDDLDERQIAAWMKQVAAVPGVGGKKR